MQAREKNAQLREAIREEFLSVLRDSDKTLQGALDDDALLLETGMDSLGFAILVTQLEERLGYDPFLLMKDPYYPKTFGEFVAVYEKYHP